MEAGDAAGHRTVVTYAGRLADARALRSQLRSPGEEFASDNEAEVVLRAYRRWGEDRVDRIEGTYAFTVRDERREELPLVRDRMGVKPLSHAPTAHGVLFGSEPKAIPAAPRLHPAVDADGLRDVLSIARMPGRAVFRGVREVRPGSAVRAGRGRSPIERTYWALRAGERTDGLDKTGDDVSGGYNWQRFDRWVHTDTFPWAAEGRGRFDGTATVFDAGLLTTLDLATYEHDCHRDAIAELGAREVVADPAEARHREVTCPAPTRHARVLLDRLDRLDRLGTAAGLDIRVPFADPRLLAYAFDAPWSMKSYDGREKSVLRDVLPEQVALRDATVLEGVGRAVLETALQLDDRLRTYDVRIEF